MNEYIDFQKVLSLDNTGAVCEAAELKNQVLTTSDSDISWKIKHYISENGDDNNDGLSPEKPLKTVYGLKIGDILHGHAILFERGGTFRIPKTIIANGGLFYGAYGSGEKPKLLGSIRDYADPNIWSEKEKDIWVLKLPLSSASMMNFNNDTYLGVKKALYSEVVDNGDFYHDTDEGVLYLKCSLGNPGSVFDNIEIATTSYIFKTNNTNNVTIENLCMKYAACHGIICADVNDITIRNCEIGWVGGIFVKDSLENRYGNAIEFWYRAENIIVENCWIYQAFDAALTFQGDGPGITTFKNIHFENNLIEYCSMNFEYWVRFFNEKREKMQIGFMHGIRFCDNILRCAGYGWGGIQRLVKPDQAFLLCWNTVFREDVMKDFYIMDNIFDTADCSMIYAIPPSMQKGLYVTHNSYFQREPTGKNTHNQIIRVLDINAHNQTEFEDAIRLFDSKPNVIKWMQ
ncbi:MAG: right-handed parallel beta-helix repeat-containing protein [Clostridia bacterium]|nr:right-handed parallel beta-helix repeat-containing protein [Clostridia bacterium]